MSSIRIDKKHSKILDKLIARMTLKGQKISKKQLVGELIELAAAEEQKISKFNELPDLKEDPAWKGLSKTYKSGIKDLSTSVDQLLYRLEGENE